MYLRQANGDWIESAFDPGMLNSTSSFVITLDFDGVVSEPYEMKSESLATLGYDITPDKCGRDYCMNKIRIPKDVYEMAVFEVYVKEMLRVPLANSVTAVLSCWEGKGYYVFVVTARSDEMMPQLFEYIEKHGLRFNGVANTNGESKYETIVRLSPDVFIEDSYFNMLDVLGSASKNSSLERCNFILFTNVANRKVFVNKQKITKLTGGWESLQSTVDGIYQSKNKAYLTVK